ncbi:MAG TPA: DUF4215 domain-containing protein [Nannocystaceae bacterium]|nr:DUF4215 domain-containing protein [Nannocystaceae bacterium]
MSQSRRLVPFSLATLLACQGDLIADPSATDADTGTNTGATASITTDPTTGSTTTGSTGEPSTTESSGDTTRGGPDPVCGDDMLDPGEECDNGTENGDDQACTAGCKVNVCGDGLQGPGEGCDDGNVQDGDECKSDCGLPSCGDGVLGGGEACDDGNADNTDACTDTCTAAVCGDNFIQPESGEECDAGAGNADDQACTAGCKINVCGDGLKGPGEGCDDGNILGGDDCSATCSLPTCGDGRLGGGEACDDGNADNTDDCTDTCTPAVCGDGYVQPDNGENCDNGASNADDQACTSGCKINVCGDGLKGPGEGCDDGNVLNGDECTSQCSLPDCGDGFVSVGEACDDGNAVNTDACTNACTPATCGDGFVQPVNGEVCDDGVNNSANAACTHKCLKAVCGDGFVLAGVEECDAGPGNGDEQACKANCKLNVCGDGKVGPEEICDDGNQVDNDACSNMCEGLTAALNLKFSQTKRFDFSWASVDGATHYKLLERVTANDPYTQIGGDIVGTSVSHTMPLHLRFGASYILKTCDGNGCTNSAPVAVVNSMASAVGYIKASNTGADQFGAAVALSADGKTLAVGAQEEDSAATGIDGDQADNSADNAGAVYVFVEVGGIWSQQAYIKASNTGAGDGFGGGAFGGDLALSADGNTLAIGASREDSAATGVGGDQSSNAATDSGAVYVFKRANAAWSQQAYIKASNTGEKDLFGYGVALSADGDTLAVGAVAETSGATGINGDQADNSVPGAGAAYVFVRANGVWSQQAYVKAAKSGYAQFGIVVALSGNGDTLAVGARGESNTGAAYVFVRANKIWSQQAHIKASNPAANDAFGKSIALSTDGNTLAVGATWEDSAATGVNGDQANDAAKDSGAAYVFVRANNLWSQQAYIKASNTGVEDWFGWSVALSGDGDALVVGTYPEDSAAVGIGGDQGNNNASGAGAAYVFLRTNGAWHQRSYVKASNTEALDYFGRDVALSGDGSILVAGASAEDSAAVGIGGDQANNAVSLAGAVYLY